MFLTEFLNHLRAKQYSEKTVTMYKDLLNHFTVYCNDKKLGNIQNVKESDIITYFNTMEKGTKYYYCKVIRIKKYFNFLEDRGYIFYSPIKDLPLPKYRKKHHPSISQKKIQKILDRLKTDNPTCIKGKAVMELLYSSALRPREVYSLQTGDVDFKNRLLFISQSKNKKDRIIPVGQKALYWITRYIEDVRPQYIKKEKHRFIFVSHKTGKKLTRFGIKSVIYRTLSLSGFNNIRPYSFRATSATMLLLNGMSIEYISKLLGHVELKTTQIYLRAKHHDLEKILLEKHPRHDIEKQIIGG